MLRSCSPPHADQEAVMLMSHGIQLHTTPRHSPSTTPTPLDGWTEIFHVRHTTWTLQPICRQMCTSLQHATSAAIRRIEASTSSKVRTYHVHVFPDKYSNARTMDDIFSIMILSDPGSRQIFMRRRGSGCPA